MPIHLFPHHSRSDKQRAHGSSGQFLGRVFGGVTGLAGIIAFTAFFAVPTQAQRTSAPESDTYYRRRTIIIHPAGVWPYPHPVPQQEVVRVEFDALGSDWGAVYLNGQLIYRPHNFNRRKTVYLRPGGYRLVVTGVTQTDLWASGYLDVGRDDSNLVVIRFSKANGVQVAGAPYVWIPDE